MFPKRQNKYNLYQSSNSQSTLKKKIINILHILQGLCKLMSRTVLFANISMLNHLKMKATHHNFKSHDNLVHAQLCQEHDQVPLQM